MCSITEPINLGSGGGVTIQEVVVAELTQKKLSGIHQNHQV